MQTFLPYSDFNKTASILDRARLGKQRVETMQIMGCFVTPTRWKNHPAVKMWKDYPWALLQYQKSICNEWTSRGYKDTCLSKTIELYNLIKNKNIGIFPPWLDGKIHLTHRSNLLRKKPEFYSQLFGKIPNDLEYLWPIN